MIINGLGQEGGKFNPGEGPFAPSELELQMDEVGVWDTVNTEYLRVPGAGGRKGPFYYVPSETVKQFVTPKEILDAWRKAQQSGQLQEIYHRWQKLSGLLRG